MRVFLTIDTEVRSPLSPNWRETGAVHEIARDIYGRTERGDFGVGHKMDVMDAHGLKGVFFLEGLLIGIVGVKTFSRVVSEIQNRGHEVQIHIHTEWLPHMERPLFGGKTGKNIGQFTEDEQYLLLTMVIENLRKCGALDPCAFRAGNYGANFQTMRALARLGVAFDTSYNAMYLDSTCGLRTERPLWQPARWGDVWELPISAFEERPGCLRPAQICACSTEEMRHALLGAWREGWKTFVIVSHSFELVNRAKRVNELGTVNAVNQRRFEKVCEFLGQNRDKFETSGFHELEPADLETRGEFSPLTSNLRRTAWRYMEQVASRLS